MTRSRPLRARRCAAAASPYGPAPTIATSAVEPAPGRADRTATPEAAPNQQSLERCLRSREPPEQDEQRSGDRDEEQLAVRNTIVNMHSIVDDEEREQSCDRTGETPIRRRDHRDPAVGNRGRQHQG